MRCSAFGLDITSRLELPGDWRCAGDGLPPLAIEPAGPDDLARAWSGAARAAWSGLAFVAEHGTAGDLLMREGDDLAALLSPSGDRLLVAGAEAPGAMRALLDSALFTVSLLTGHEALHAGAVVTDAGLLAVAGDTGAGKSSLVAALLGAGCGFFADDVLVLERHGLIAAPGPPVMAVPSAAADGLGAPLAEFGDETWLAVTGASGALPLAGIVRLEADGGGPPDWAWLLSRMLRFPRVPERERARFEIAADIAGAVPMHRLPARSGSPDDLAEQALDWVRSAPRD
jgi:hypothetical protein